MITIVIPIIRFNDFSHKAISDLGQNNGVYQRLKFLFAVSDESIAQTLREYLADFKNEYDIYVANSYSSNFLRSFCRKATTSHVYFQDCDDYADYKLLDDYAHRELPTDTVLCFDVTRHVYNEMGLLSQKALKFTRLQEGCITDIEKLPTCVYSKIIPTRIISDIYFPNLPYSQDWAISYQLFFRCKHIFIKRSSYTYNNYPTSSSAQRNSKKHGTNRVNVYGRNLCKTLKEEGHLYESDILQYKYCIMLTERYNYIGVHFLRTHLTWRMFFCHFSIRQSLAYVYRNLQIVRIFLLGYLR